MANNKPIRLDKSISELAREALWFILYSLFAVVLLEAVLAAMTLGHPDRDAVAPKIFATVLAFLIPMTGGFLVVRLQSNRANARIARTVWVAALLDFSVVCVWVLNLPTGRGLCEGCTAAQKLTRTFFAIHQGSGLIGGDGLLIGAWMPLAMLGFSAGAALGFRTTYTSTAKRAA